MRESTKKLKVILQLTLEILVERARCSSRPCPGTLQRSSGCEDYQTCVECWGLGIEQQYEQAQREAQQLRERAKQLEAGRL